MLLLGYPEAISGAVGGFGGGVAQIIVLGPCTYLVTASVAAEKGTSMLSLVKKTYLSNGIRGFFPGGTALMLRQGTNWASRQGFTDVARTYIKKQKTGPNPKLSIFEETMSGIIGRNCCYVVCVFSTYRDVFLLLF
jgi:hypothetical protein